MNKFNVYSGKMRLTVFLLSFFFLINNTSAEQGSEDGTKGSLQVSPLKYDWVVNLGDEKKGEIILKNNDSEPIYVEIEIEDFSVSQDLQASTNFFVPNENHPLKAYDVISWIDIDKSTFMLEAGESRKINFNVHVPSKTPTGGYNGVILFTKRPIVKENEKAAVKIDVVYRLGVLVRLGVKGNEPIIEKGKLKLFEPTRKVFIDNPVGFNVQVTNNGNFPYKMSGFIDIFKYGKKVVTLEIAQNFIYAERTRGFGGIPTWNTSLLDVGKYEAKLHLVSEDEKIVIEGDTSFLILPWKLLIGAFIILIVIIVIFQSGRLSAKKKERKN